MTFTAKSLAVSFTALTLLSACGPKSPEAQILGKWTQTEPVSTTTNGLEIRKSNAVLIFKKDGDVRLTRTLEFAGAGLPEEGLAFDINLDGDWSLAEGVLVQTLETVIVTPRSAAPEAADTARQLEQDSLADPQTRKTIVKLDNRELMVQDIDTGITDIYTR